MRLMKMISGLDANADLSASPSSTMFDALGNYRKRIVV
jgi:hypothetical protein